MLLLPQLAAVDVESVSVEGDALVVVARNPDGPAACTGCGRPSAWVHSAYERHVLDEAIGGRALQIEL